MLSGCETRAVPRPTHPSPFRVTAVMDRETGKQADRQKQGQADRRQAVRDIGRQANGRQEISRQVDTDRRQADRQTGSQACIIQTEIRRQTEKGEEEKAES